MSDHIDTAVSTSSHLEPDGRASPTLENELRLVDSPVFVLGTPRCGSTLLRVILDSHSRIRAPHEMWLRMIHVKVPKAFAAPAMEVLGLDDRALDHLLWDRLLHRELLRSGKQIIVDKTPFNAHIWERLAECWPNARFIFLLRHPAAIVDSLARLVKDFPPVDRSPEKNEREIVSHALAVESARQALTGITVRYEDLVAHPERETQKICRFLQVEWEPQMVDYGAFDHGPIRPGLGDASDMLRSGRVQPARPLPDRALRSDELLGLARAWGYSERAATTAPGSENGVLRCDG